MLMFSRGIEPPPPPPCSWPCSRPPANAATAPKVSAADPAAAPARNARRSRPSSRMRCAPPVRPGSTYPRQLRMDHPHVRLPVAAEVLLQRDRQRHETVREDIGAGLRE